MFSRNTSRPGRHARDDRRSATPQAQPRRQPEPVRAGAARGPYDVTEAPDGVARLDLGSLEIPAVEGVEVRVQADPNGAVSQVVLVHGHSALQLGALAAPRSEGIWDEVREDLRDAMAGDGIRAQEVEGEYGMELRARVPTPDGPADVRFVGIDGPRWMVRALFQGPAAADPERAGPLGECLAGLVVNRGPEARPVREELPLRLPREMAAHAEAQAAGADQDPTPPDAPVDR